LQYVVVEIILKTKLITIVETKLGKK